MVSEEIVRGVKQAACEYAERINRTIKPDDVEFAGYDNRETPEPYWKCWYSFGMERKVDLFGEAPEPELIPRDFIYVWFRQLTGPARLAALKAMFQ